nr:PrpF domain-containing protein [Streptomyces sp. Xyl84]
MIGHIAYASGSPCPTLVLDARQFPREREPLLEALTEVRRRLVRAGGAHILKIALIEPSSHPLFDLDYRFIQALPDGLARFDLRGSCGHSVLCSVMAAGRSGMLPRQGPGDRVRVHVLNNGDHLVCETEEADRETARCTMYFLHTPPVPVAGLLLRDEPQTILDLEDEKVTVSMVSSGNPYVFVGAREAGVSDAAELFAGGAGLFDRLGRIRSAAARLLDWPPDGAFPKIAVVVPDGAGRIAARAVTVPGWHPTLALTGAVCLGAASCIPETVPWLAAREVGCLGGQVDIRTTGGSTAVTATTRIGDGRTELAWVAVGNKTVRYHGPFFPESLTRFRPREFGECLSLPA